MAPIPPKHLLAAAISVLCFMLSAAAPVYAQSTDLTARVTVEISREIHRQYATDAQIDAVILKTYGVKLAPEKLQVARRILKDILFDEAVPKYVAGLIVPVWRTGMTVEQMQQAMLEGIMQLQVKGIGRLPAQKQSLFISHILGMTRSIPSSLCKAMYLGQIDTKTSIEMERHYIANLPLERFEAISNFYREAAKAELAGYPAARTINASQAQLAEQALGVAWGTRMRKKDAVETMQLVLADMPSAQAGELCMVMSEMLEAMLEMPEPYRSWQYTLFVENMQ